MDSGQKSFLEIAERNASIYIILFEFEKRMKQFILTKMRDYMYSRYSENWTTVLVHEVDPKLYERMEQRKIVMNGQSIYLGCDAEHDIDDLLDFSAIQIICIKWWDSVFKIYFKDKIQFQAALANIGFIRNGIAHFREISIRIQKDTIDVMFRLLKMISDECDSHQSTPIAILQHKYDISLCDRYSIFNQVEHIFQSRTMVKKCWPLEETLAEAKRVEAIGISNNELTIKLNSNFFVDTLRRGTEYTLLFLDPYSRNTRVREVEEGLPKGHIRKVTEINIEHLKKIMCGLDPDCLSRIDARVYDEIPRLNCMFIDSEHLLMQYYAHYVRGEDNPSIYIRKRKNIGIFDFYYTVFERIRNRSNKLEERYKSSIIRRILS